MPACCAPGCKNRSEKDRKFGRKTLFSLPTGLQDSKKREIWLQMINRRDIGSLKNLRLCEDHFAPDQYERHRADGLKKLRHDAIPSIFSRTHSDSEEIEHDCLDVISQDVQNITNRLFGQSSTILGRMEMPFQTDVEAFTVSVTDSDYVGLAMNSSCEKEKLPNVIPGEMLHVEQLNQQFCSNPIKRLEHSYSQAATPVRLEECGMTVSGLLTPILSGLEISIQPDIEAYTVFIADNDLTGLSEFMGMEKENLEDFGTPCEKQPMREPSAQPSKQIKRDDHSYSKGNSQIADENDVERVLVIQDDADVAIVPETVVEVFADSSNSKWEEAAYEATRLNRLLISEQKRRRRAEEKLRRVEDSIKDVLAEDQLEMLVKGTMRGSSWSEATMNKALKLRTVCGSRGYDYLKNNCFPLPSERTLQKHIRAKFVKHTG